MNIPDTVALDNGDRCIVIIDQTLLPAETRLIKLRSQEEIIEAIKTLRVRGAPAIGVCAAFGVYLAACQAPEGSGFFEYLDRACDALSNARPTAVNLFCAVNEMRKTARASLGLPREQLCRKLYERCMKFRNDDVDACRRIGENALPFFRRGDGILTHCNAGRLAAVRYGTALAPIYLGAERGYDFTVYADETRPLLQGARLTAYELAVAGIRTVLACDNMASSLMRTGKINAVITGADRIAKNRDVVNKIGTSGIAILAKYYGIPFYVAAPKTTFDPCAECGADVIIENRSPDEVTELWYKKRMTHPDVSVYNPAFDVTLGELVTAIITENGTE